MSAEDAAEKGNDKKVDQVLREQQAADARVNKLLLLGQSRARPADAASASTRQRTRKRTANPEADSEQPIDDTDEPTLAPARSILPPQLRLSPLRSLTVAVACLSRLSSGSGAGASGKSTLFKQMINIYGKGFPEAYVPPRNATRACLAHCARLCPACCSLFAVTLWLVGQ